jgi:hypothetical protein
MRTTKHYVAVVDDRGVSRDYEYETFEQAHNAYECVANAPMIDYAAVYSFSSSENIWRRMEFTVKS